MEDLGINLTLIDDSGVLTAVAYEQLHVFTNNANDYEKFSFPFASLDKTFVAGRLIGKEWTNLAPNTPIVLGGTILVLSHEGSIAASEPVNDMEGDCYVSRRLGRPSRDRVRGSPEGPRPSLTTLPGSERVPRNRYRDHRRSRRVDGVDRLSERDDTRAHASFPSTPCCGPTAERRDNSPSEQPVRKAYDLALGAEVRPEEEPLSTNVRRYPQQEGRLSTRRCRTHST